MAAVNFLRFLLLADNHIVNKVRNINRQPFAHSQVAVRMHLSLLRLAGLLCKQHTRD